MVEESTKPAIPADTLEETMTATTATSTGTDHVLLQDEVVTHSGARKALALLRIAFGLTFLWAFFDKLLALGFSTGRSVDEAGVETVSRFGDAAWINGGNPTLGFLKFGAKGPFKDFYNGIAGDAWVNWLFMFALLGIGLALTFGIGMRVAAIGGAVLYLMMWTVALPPENNPVLDDHLLGMVSVMVLGLTLAGDTWGAGKAWAKTGLVRKNPILR
jgi:thiosulfate dehydrogenase [quinone] large subunit